MTTLDLRNLINVLDQASCGPSSNGQAELQLTEWEIQPNFHYLLQTIYIDLSIPLQLRWLAIIKFKNGIEKYWRSSRQYAISKEEKHLIKSRVFELIDEKNKQLAIQNAQAISRICRLDFPLEWPTLMEDFERILQNAASDIEGDENNVKVYNLLLIFNQIIKVLASVKIGRIKPSLQSKIPILMPLLVRIYIKYSNEWITDMDLTDFSVMEIGYLSLKILRRLIVDIYDNFHDSHEIKDFLNLSIQHFQHLNVNYQENEILTKYLKCFSKIYYLLITKNLLCFIQLESCTEILLTLWKLLQEKAEFIYNNNDVVEENNIWEFLAIKTLLIYKQIFAKIYSNQFKINFKKQDKFKIEQSILKIREIIFTDFFIKQLTDLLINYYIKLRPTDLESWTTEPEEWTNDSINDNYEYQIRQCSENFFQDLIINFQEILVPYLLDKIENEMYHEANINNILFKDSIFTIFQLSANAIYKIIDFNFLFETFFLPEAFKDDMMEYKILKRRLCLLIKEWYPLEIINDDNLSKIYSMILNFLNCQNLNNDKVVKIVALQLFDSIIIGYELKREILKPKLTEFIQLIIYLIDDMELIETKNFLFRLISNIISLNLLSEIELLNLLINIVIKYWDQFNDENELILKGTILRILTNLNKSLGDSCFKTFQVSLPLIKICCCEKSKFFTILSEDGFELWLTILQNYPKDKKLEISLLENFNELFIDSLLNQTEILPLILEILKSYILLIPEYFLVKNEIPFKIFEILAGYIGNMRDDSYELVLNIVETLIISFYSFDFEELLKLLIDSKFLIKFTDMTIDDTQSDLIISKNLIIFARLSYFKPEFLIEFLKFYYSSSSNINSSQEDDFFFIKKFLDIWYIKLDENIPSSRHRKIMLLGLTKIFGLGIFHNLKILLSLLTLHFEEINEEGTNIEEYYAEYTFTFQYNENDYSLKENGEYQRFISLIRSNDPVNNVNLKNLVKETLQILSSSSNDLENLKNLLIINSDQTIFENFQYFLNM